MAEKIYCAFGSFRDALAGCTGSYRGGNRPWDVARGIFAACVGAGLLAPLYKICGPRMGVLFAGHARPTLPDQRGRIGAYGDPPQDPIAMMPRQKADLYRRTLKPSAKARGCCANRGAWPLSNRLAPMRRCA